MKKAIRETVVFAIQNVTKDPPFTKLDMISCRNVLIYMEPNLQSRIIPLFHYGLKPGGILFLSSSETIGPSTNLFTPVEKKWKFFRAKPQAGTLMRPTARFLLGPRNSRRRGKR